MFDAGPSEGGMPAVPEPLSAIQKESSRLLVLLLPFMLLLQRCCR